MPSMNRTEIDRQLLQVERAQRDAMPRWRELLERVFSGDERLSPAEKAELLGVPARRQVLRVGGISIAGAALLAACGDDDDAAESSDTTAPDSTGSAEMDLVLANTAISLEILAVDTYQAAIESGLVTTPAVGDAAALFQSHHAQHRDALVGVVQGAGATPVSSANQVVKDAVVQPALAVATAEADVVRLAYDLEMAAAQTYVFAATSLSTPQLRSTIMTIGGIESRHATILEMTGALGEPKPAFFPSTNPLPEGAVISG
jgi:hypothetical protein